MIVAIPVCNGYDLGGRVSMDALLQGGSALSQPCDNAAENSVCHTICIIRCIYGGKADCSRVMGLEAIQFERKKREKYSGTNRSR